MNVYVPSSDKLIHNSYVDMMDRSYIPHPVHIVQYDKRLPILAVKMYKNQQNYSLPSSAKANIRFGKGDGTFVYKPALGVDNSGSIIYFEISLQMTTVSGEVYPVVELDINDDIAHSSPIPIVIERNPVSEDMIESSTVYTTVKEYAERVEQTVIKALESETNAKRSEENAKASETAAKNSETNAKASENHANVYASNAFRYASNALDSEEASKESKNAAAQSELNAKEWYEAAKRCETNASDSEDAAGISAENAQNAEKSAKESALSAYDSEKTAVESAKNAKTSEYNANVSAANAKTSEESVKSAEINARVSMTTAKNSETNAKASEAAAKRSEENAKASETAASANVAKALAVSERSNTLLVDINKKLGLADFDIDSDGNLIYSSAGGYNFWVSEDGNLNWEVA